MLDICHSDPDFDSQEVKSPSFPKLSNMLEILTALTDLANFIPDMYDSQNLGPNFKMNKGRGKN